MKKNSKTRFLYYGILLLSLYSFSQVFAREPERKTTEKLAKEIVLALKNAGVKTTLENGKKIYSTEIDCSEHGSGAGADPADPQSKKPHEFHCEKPLLENNSKAKNLLNALERTGIEVDHAMGGWSGVSNIRVTCMESLLKTECDIRPL